MAPLNDLIRDLHARNCTVRVHTPSTWMTAKEHYYLNASTAIALTPTNTTSNSACPNAIGLVHDTRRDDASLSGNNSTSHRSRQHSNGHTHTPRDTDPNSPTHLYPRYTTVQFHIPRRLETWTAKCLGSLCPTRVWLGSNWGWPSSLGHPTVTVRGRHCPYGVAFPRGRSKGPTYRSPRVAHALYGVRTDGVPSPTRS